MNTTTLKQPVRARLVTPDYPELAVRPTLRYNSADPYAVHIDFPAHVSADGEGLTWMFARSLLEEGLETPAGVGDVHIRPCGWARTILEFHSPLGLAVIRFSSGALQRFLLRTYDVVEPGTENLGPSFEHGLSSLLGDAV
ncbi:SsgA family sporulation/cell division regulator [Streptomyces fulvoviolaceus]|uniref:SsgA family sporulation/cell division regulator n=1 Tax=Streptomyces fulvoviolaceus TaxID=285535 RepID=UPI0021C089AB|nr:SsgA family sporulation/cell division regulator [Streptomyces fulvoviolaceus]MCT9081474.1 SsgA family sporulation/cell division regulator [Streptomyces fulvoviolaceus]